MNLGQMTATIEYRVATFADYLYDSQLEESLNTFAKEGFQLINAREVMIDNIPHSRFIFQRITQRQMGLVQ